MKKHTIVCSAVALALAPLLVGCGSGPGTIRGQSPAAAAAPHQMGNHYFQPGHPYAQLVGHQVPGSQGAGPAARPAGCADGSCGGASCSTCGNGRGHGGGKGGGCADGQCGVNGCDGNCDANGGRRPGPYAGGPYPGGPYPGGPYPGGGMMQGGGGGGGNSANMWHPTHYHTFTYREPKNLVYPQQNQPAGVVQYPYYTVKGPDCFFLK